jgi:hypothetical protein
MYVCYMYSTMYACYMYSFVHGFHITVNAFLQVIYIYIYVYIYKVRNSKFPSWQSAPFQLTILHMRMFASPPLPHDAFESIRLTRPQR